MDEQSPSSRRQFLRLAGSAAVVGVAGCGGGGPGTDGNDTGETTTTITMEDDETTAADNETTAGNETTADNETTAGNETTADNETTAGNETALSGPVPESERTATSQGGTPRNQDALQAKSEVSYQSQPNGDQQCSNCTFYVEDMNGDGLGACAIVEGLIEPEGWCVSYAPFEGGG